MRLINNDPIIQLRKEKKTYLYPSPAIPSLLYPTRHSSVVASSTIPLSHFPYFPLPSILTGSTTIVFEFPY